MGATGAPLTPGPADSHFWLQRRRGAAAPVLIGVLGLAALGLAQQLPIRHSVESDLTQRSRAALRSAGLTGVLVDFSGRDGRLTGSVATPQDVVRALAAVRGLDGVRVATADLVVPGAHPTAATGTAQASAPAGGPPSAQPTAASAPRLTAVTAGGKVTLSGTVPSDDARAGLIEAVTAGFGAGNVVDHLTLDPAVSSDGVAGFGGIVTALGNDSTATADLNDGLVTLTGVVKDAAAATAAGNAATTVTGDAARVTSRLSLAATGTGNRAGTDPVAVQARLNALPQASFDSGSSTLTAAGRGVVLQAATILRAAPGTRVNLRGYTDDLGDWTVNLGLSTARANTVRLTLIDNGVAASTLSVSGYSSDYPKVPNDSPAHRAMNRRVVFAVTS